MVLLIIVIPYYFIIKNIEVFIMNLKYKKATIEDLDILTKTRIEVLRAANKLSNDINMDEVKMMTYKYYKKPFVMERILLI